MDIINFLGKNNTVKGRIHSYETCGTVDGPGIRFVLFTQGCLMRCKYCHNPDTWDLHGGKEVTVEELMQEVVSYQHYLKASGGGVTASGGESILQPEFIRDWFRACKDQGFHTCLDTNGFVRHYTPVIDELLDVTDLVLLDIKEMDDSIHQDLIGVSNKNTLRFAKYLQQKNIKVWIRYVVVPGYTDSEKDIRALGEFTKEMTNIEQITMLPYHKLGVHKWKALGKQYELEGVNPPSKETMARLQAILDEYRVVAPAPVLATAS